MSWLHRLALIVVMSTASTQLAAAPCAGFVDVDDASAFCPNVDWVRNRGITVGCTAAEYCPGANVTRLQMAAFLNRVGTAMTPVQLRADDTPGALALDAAPIVCQSAALATATFPRRAVLDGALHATATADVSLATELVVTTDGGANWVAVTSQPSSGSITAGWWSGIPSLAHVDLAHGQQVRFGIRASRGAFPGSTNLTASQCQLRVLVFSRDGASPPF